MTDQQGYEVPRTILRLEFADPSFDGLVIRAYAPPWGVTSEGAELAFIDISKKITKQTWANIRKVIDGFGDSLVEWNQTIDGKPLPANRAGVARLDMPYLWQLIQHWIGAGQQAMAQAIGAQRAAVDVREIDLPMEIAD